MGIRFNGNSGMHTSNDPLLSIVVNRLRNIVRKLFWDESSIIEYVSVHSSLEIQQRFNRTGFLVRFFVCDAFKDDDITYHTHATHPITH